MSTSENLNIYQVVMPRLGLTMTEAKILEWLKPEGSWVNKGEPLFVIENEKSTLEIESPSNGYLNIQAQAGIVVPILKMVAYLSGGEEVAGHHKVESLTQIGPSSSVMPLAVSSVVQDKPSAPLTLKATPKARTLARHLDVDLTSLVGSGLRGMVVASDVQKAFQKPVIKASPVARKVAAESGIDLGVISGSGPRGMVLRRDVEQVAVHPLAPVPSSSDLRSLSGLRGIIAERLSNGWRERPQVTLTTDADATSLVAARQQLNLEMEKNGAKISYNAILIKLVSRALQEFPYMNVQLTSNGIQVIPETNIGVAVDTERGLLVPVVHQAAGKTLIGINQELGALVDRATAGKCLPDELSGGTFTITNLGMYDIDAFTPIINPPECAILGVGRIISRPVGINGEVVLRDMIALSLSFDHRLVDGAPAAKFLQRVKQLIERPIVLAIFD